MPRLVNKAADKQYEKPLCTVVWLGPIHAAVWWLSVVSGCENVTKASE